MPSGQSHGPRDGDRNETLALPQGFKSIADVLDGKVPVSSLINVVGLVKDFRVPMPTSGTDSKSALTLFDRSTEEDGRYINVNIFRNEAESPRPGAGDVVMLTMVRVQNYRGELSFITNWSTEIFVYTASKIPTPPAGAAVAMQPPLRPNKPLPGEKEHRYVSWMYYHIDKGEVPETSLFLERVESSARFREKFSLLEGVRDSSFHDIIGRVVKNPYDQMDKATLWITDYTENEAFYKFSWGWTDPTTGRDGDPYGYTTKKRTADSEQWPGPFGRRCMQITCWQPHAAVVREQVKAGSWVRLRNVQIKWGHNANNLEGFLREDRGAFQKQIQVEIFDMTDSDNIDDRLKDVLRRKKDYDREFKKQRKSLASNDENPKPNAKKRKANEADQPKMNSKQRRQAARLAAQNKEAEDEAKQEETLNLNGLVKCESIHRPASTVSQILKPAIYKPSIEGEEVEIAMPFVNEKYRANVRVVDFHPSKLESFATWRKFKETDILSDDGGDSDSESDEEMDGTLDMYGGHKIWEWRFALQLEEAGKRPTAGTKPACMWVVVDNLEAQALLGLDATDLRKDEEVLASLREKLFKLWGNLEEQKMAEKQRQAQLRQRLAADEPPPDSDDEAQTTNPAGGAANGVAKLSNKAFACCIRQYGVSVREDDPTRADAGGGRRFARMYGLFGTKISG